ncbi:MAG: SRPBCC domain-containing protein [Mycobacteriaceae bacterium]|nr:SRPBCC domain-containing protein [Mycobacteriaceae bacterium]
MVFRIDSELDIDAPAPVVWQVITDFSRYSEWNRFCLEAKSTLEVGSPIDMNVRLAGTVRRQREWVLSHSPGREFSYRMKPVPFGALRSLRSHTVTPLGPDRTRYVSRFEIRGWLQPVVTAVLGRTLRTGFAAMTAGIETESERVAKLPE